MATTRSGTPYGDEFFGGTGDDNIDGKGGVNQVTYDGPTAVNVNLPNSRAIGQGTDALTAIQRVFGSGGNDTIVANGGPGCSIVGRAGDDTISSVGNGCELLGGNGNDTITGSNGSDIVYPDDSAPGNDTVRAGAGDDRVMGDGGNDDIDGGLGLDLLRYDLTSNPLQAELGFGTITGLGNDVVANIEDFTGSSANDSIRGTAEANNIDGREGNDTIFGGDGDDVLNGSIGNDWMDGNRGNDKFLPSNGDDMMYGEDGADTVSFETSPAAVTVLMSSLQAMGDGNDRFVTVENVIGSSGHDYIVGDINPNVIDGGAGTDYCDGAGGGDTLIRCP
jgi:Ca2+-binding RTX toxin-like protein